MNRLAKFAKLPATEKRFFLRAVILLGYYRVALLIVPLHRLLRGARCIPVSAPLAGGISANRLTQLINAAARLIPGSTCLSNALAARRLFAGQGYATRIHFGVTKNVDDTFQAHAWLTLADAIVIGMLPDIAKYRELPEPDSLLFKQPY